MNPIPTIKKILPRSLYNFIKKTYYGFTDTKTHSDFDVRSIYAGHQNVTYRGIKAIRCPFDYVLYQMIINEVKPDLIIEIGTHKGGSALYFADILSTLGGGMVHTIDIEPMYDEKIAHDPRIKLFSSGWENYDIREADGYKKILVIEDGAHTYEHSIGAINKFAPLVSVNSYLIIEDGVIDELGMKEKYNGGPVRAIHEFLKHTPHFKIDRSWCDFFGKNATFNIDGYLKRIK